MKKIKLIIREKNVIFGLLLVIFVVGFFPNIKFNSDSLSHGNVKIENRVAADTITDVAEKETVTINFYDSVNRNSKVQSSETMTVNVGEYVWPVNLGDTADQSLKNVYHMYQIPQIANYTYQSSSQSSPLLVTDNPANNVINLYYKNDKQQSQVTINFFNSENQSSKVQDSETITVNVGEYAKDTPDQSEALPPSQIVEKGDSVSPKLPYGYSILKVVNVDDESESYSSLEEALENQKGSEAKTFRVIVSANKSSLKLTVHEPNGEIKIEDFSGLYGATYQLPIEKNLIFNGKIYHAIITITKRDWRMGTSISLAQSPDEIASLLKDNILVGKYDSSVISIDVSYKEEGIVPIPPSDGGANSSSSTQSSEKTADKTDNEKNNEDKIVSSTTTPPPASKEKESSVEKKKEVEQVHSENKVMPKKEIKVPLAPPTPSFSTAEKVIASPSVTSEINQEAHILKMRIAGAAGLATGTVSAYGILRALKMMIQHFGKLGKF